MFRRTPKPPASPFTPQPKPSNQRLPPSLSDPWDRRAPHSGSGLITVVPFHSTYLNGAIADRTRPLCERALAISEKVLGPEHPRTATSLNNLAILLRNQGDLAGALPLCERALAIYEKALGPEHSSTGRARTNYAHLLLAAGDAAAAQAKGEAALTTHEKSLGAKHRWTADSARITAGSLAALGRIREADAMRKRFGID
jgi:tetratricopeptide (TPR) repeat protein